ncbi:uncharacterized protein N7525_009506 [Penicillium rubens]|jgi:hypothetical protein|uniref:uncharacterized protein n=1 Tax=Penicillium rubens TaxID=1108849 RepID=UPI002A5A0556|nr:uncharacterized protein N7525_009506 [Penicillium rubens]KAJ5831253.1 hypothetical protein N7525_009506 [Penicillium rubens]
MKDRGGSLDVFMACRQIKARHHTSFQQIATSRGCKWWPTQGALPPAVARSEAVGHLAYPTLPVEDGVEEWGR